MSKAFAVIGAICLLFSTHCNAELPYKNLVEQTIHTTISWYVDNNYDHSHRAAVIKTCNSSTPIYVKSRQYVFVAFSIFGCGNSKISTNFVLTIRYSGYNTWQVLSNDEVSDGNLNELAIVDDTLFITYLTIGPDDAFCCPSVKITHRYQITSRGIQFLN